MIGGACDVLRGAADKGAEVVDVDGEAGDISSSAARMPVSSEVEDYGVVALLL